MQVSLGLKTVVNPLLGQERPRAQPEVAAGGGRFQPMKWPDSGAVRDQRWRLDDVRPRLADGEPVLRVAAGHCRRAPRGKCRVLYRLQLCSSLLSPHSSPQWLYWTLGAGQGFTGGNKETLQLPLRTFTFTTALQFIICHVVTHCTQLRQLQSFLSCQRPPSVHQHRLQVGPSGGRSSTTEMIMTSLWPAAGHARGSVWGRIWSELSPLVVPAALPPTSHLIIGFVAGKGLDWIIGHNQIWTVCTLPALLEQRDVLHVTSHIQLNIMEETTKHEWNESMPAPMTRSGLASQNLHKTKLRRRTLWGWSAPSVLDTLNVYFNNGNVSQINLVMK